MGAGGDREARRGLGPDQWLEAEELQQFLLSIGEERVRVWVRLDFAFRDEERRVVIVDWKTGRSREGAEDHRTQLTCYALYAMQAWQVEADRVLLLELNLFEGEAIQHRVTQADIEAVRAFIRGSVGDMRSLLENPLENLAREEDFPRTHDPSRCAHCPFLRLCRPGWTGRVIEGAPVPVLVPLETAAPSL